jgi:hypothetical protein
VAGILPAADRADMAPAEPTPADGIGESAACRNYPECGRRITPQSRSAGAILLSCRMRRAFEKANLRLLFDREGLAAGVACQAATSNRRTIEAEGIRLLFDETGTAARIGSPKIMTTVRTIACAHRDGLQTQTLLNLCSWATLETP